MKLMLPIRHLVVASTLFASMLAHAGLFDDDEARKAILDLRQQITQLKTAITNSVTSQQRNTDEVSQLRKSLLDLQNQIERQKSDMSQLRGENELLAKTVSELQIRMKDMSQVTEQKIKANELRSQENEQKLAKVDKVELVQVVVDDVKFMAETNEKRDYDAAFALFRSGDFVKSQRALFEFLQRYPSSGYSPSALYWLGNAQYSNRDYKEAIINFRNMIAKNPNHVRAPEALLSISNCQFEMKDTKAARKTIEDLMKTYPKSEAAFAGVERLRILK